jgi:hypothetical protein
MYVKKRQVVTTKTSNKVEFRTPKETKGKTFKTTKMKQREEHSRPPK